MSCLPSFFPVPEPHKGNTAAETHRYGVVQLVLVEFIDLHALRADIATLVESGVFIHQLTGKKLVRDLLGLAKTVCEACI